MGATPLRYPFVLAEAEGIEPSGPLVIVVVFAIVENVKVKFVGESPCEQFFVFNEYISTILVIEPRYHFPIYILA